MKTARFEDVTVLHETKPGERLDGALLCDIDGEEVWIPKAAIDEDSEVYENDTEGVLIIPEKLAYEKGLI